ncbi:hypothetical protein ACHAWU_001193 [Discostella pseudostelligera]|uniref:MAPEG family protein n=1 Tax=Discostella pseudostelligera TaxID=259834 RepID=A0ABD3M576_9STRA
MLKNLVTTASMILYYIFLFHQSAVAFSEFNKSKKLEGNKKSDDNNESNAPSLGAIKYGSDNSNVRAANRLVGNFHEQVIPFLVSLYLHATFVSVKGACTCGWAWIFFRSYYGYVYKKGVPILFLSTIPAYCCVWYMIGGTIYGVSTMD